MDKRVVNELQKMDDFNPFRGMVSYVGFKQTEVNFIRLKDTQVKPNIVSFLEV